MTATLHKNIALRICLPLPLSLQHFKLFKHKLVSITITRRVKNQMALQTSIKPTITISGNAGLRRQADPSALKSSYFSPSLNLLHARKLSYSSPSAPRFSMRLANKQSYICRDCGYIYNDRTPFEKLPDNYYCPVCAAPKRRFRVYEPPVNKNANATDARKSRKADLQREETLGKALPIGIAVGAAALVALYFYVNSTF